jgi:hypothetical protein
MRDVRSALEKDGMIQQAMLPNTALEPTADGAFSSASRAASRVGGGSAFVR